MSVRTMKTKYQILAPEDGADPDCFFLELVDTYTTREGALAKARTLLNQGRPVQIVPVLEETKP